eukprot:TRINITY_DN7216_c0_g1_i2.p3 TRINITY_DN7216_c0_g1~~TRINITY_DN7216_c0_g1_i2.p3  ORF type:complete len:87 (-),score=15.50 TRINITY_DN7216_c0_g1_i2:86-346(-)
MTAYVPRLSGDSSIPTNNEESKSGREESKSDDIDDTNAVYSEVNVETTYHSFDKIGSKEVYSRRKEAAGYRSFQGSEVEKKLKDGK